MTPRSTKKPAPRQAGKKKAVRKKAAKKAAKKSAAPQRMFLAVVDDTPELHQAIYYACRRVMRIGGRVALMHCIPPAEFQHFAGVGELMQEEARDHAELLLRANSEWVHGLIGENPVVYMREGDPKTELINLLNEEKDVSILILGANTNGDDPGPLVSHLTRGAAQCPVPITIVPGHLTDEDIDRLA